MRGVVVALIVMTSLARADDRDFAHNVLAGPVLGISWGRGHPTGLLLGVEAGGGFGPERINLGFESSPDRKLGYLELDPWDGLGFSFGIGLDSAFEPTGILGVWEGVPLGAECKGDGDGFHFLATISLGFRYTGMFEVYLAPKLGASQNFCAASSG